MPRPAGELADLPQEIVDGLERSGLNEAAAAIAALTVKGAAAIPRAAGLKAWALLLAYARRRLFLASFRTEAAVRLRQAIAELVENLRPLGGQTVDILDVGRGEQMYFLLFRLSRQGPIVGCLPHVHGLRITAEQWQELWSGCQ
jgi:hypothetical protein